MRKKKSQLYQSVILTFNDGTTGIFIGKAVVAPGDVNKSTVTAINFTPPKPLPPGPDAYRRTCAIHEPKK